MPIEETLTAFDELIRAGKVRHAGLSNFSGAQVAEAGEVAAHARVPAVVNLQSGYSLLDRTAAADAFDVCARLGIGFTAYSPLAGGWLSGKYRSGEAFPAGSRMTLRPEPYEGWLNPATFAGIQALGWAAAERGIPLTQLALAWVLTDPGVCEAFNWNVWRPVALYTPMQFGPMTRAFTSRAASTMLRLSAAPSRPTSSKPPLTTCTNGTRPAVSRITSAQRAAGTATRR